ncbi:ZIP family metal transporter [Candidatus Woesearchaeota archaeon CG10_big_fil_rev_8_21_14_0_10_44_13]|nr:MAG: ZIP family metal transporter [Candidatus Woesearchaeota archaeon CG10_big_fil_rev_8_21_14_0_10_44_13]
MINVWAYALTSVVVVSLVSLIGAITLSIRVERLRKLLFFLVSFSAGALLGDTFIHLFPQIISRSGFGLDVAVYILLGMLLFFILEKFIQWRHCHIPTSKHHPHPVAFMNLVGDAFHNFIDGMVIAGSYIVSVPVGMATTLAVVFHEIPQEIGDFGVLIHAGFNRKKALFFNFLSALTSVLGAVAVLAIGTKVQDIDLFLVPFTAGGFLYIAGSDLIPELHKETGAKKAVIQMIGLVLGVLIMVALLGIE